MKKYLSLVAGFIIVTIAFGTMYVTAQQSLRLGANDPQVQIAEDAAAKLNQGYSPSSVLGPTLDIRKSQAPFIIVYDKSGKVVAGSGHLNGIIPTVPYGVLQNANDKPYNFVTWQPASGVRLASVEVVAQNYYVLSARSLYEVEKREGTMLRVAAAGWFAAVFVLAVWSWLSTWR